MRSKGVSAIIATILLLMITIALAGTAYIFMRGLVDSRTSKTISVLDATCNGTHITLVISNDGTTPIDGDSAGGSDLKVFINNIEDTTFSFGSSFAPHTTNVSSEFPATSGTNSVLIVSPSNAVRQTVYC